MPHKLPVEFYRRCDVVTIARELVGKYLLVHVDGQLTGGAIVETEAYCGRDDRACHAHGGRRTRRTEIMYAPGGRAYVYLCYGLHHLFNVVTNEHDCADAVLVRAIVPEIGRDVIQARRSTCRELDWASGPGKVTRALGVTGEHNGVDLTGDKIWIEDRGLAPEIVCGTRIGVGYAGADALLPWRFMAKDSPWVSRP